MRNPVCFAITFIGNPVVRTSERAEFMRQEVRYDMGDIPTISLKFDVNVDLDIYANSAMLSSTSPC